MNRELHSESYIQLITSSASSTSTHFTKKESISNMGASAEPSTPVTQIITYTIPVGGLPECVNEGLGLVRGADGFRGFGCLYVFERCPLTPAYTLVVRSMELVWMTRKSDIGYSVRSDPLFFIAYSRLTKAS